MALLALSIFLTTPAGAASVSSIYDMNRMLSEPHPLAHQYGTRWKPAVVPQTGAAPAVMTPNLGVDQGSRKVAAPQSVPMYSTKPAPRAIPVKATASQSTSHRRSGGGGIFNEIKLGALAHDLGPFSSQKEEGVDGHVELRFNSPEFLKYIWSPYPHIGADISSVGDTSSIWIGLAWEWDFWKKYFAGFSLGGALHNGVTKQGEGQEDEKELGCSPLFRLGINFGYRFNERHSVDLLLDHISNAKICDTNEGLENFGIRYGYRF